MPPSVKGVSQIFDLGTDYYDQFSSEHRDQLRWITVI